MWVVTDHRLVELSRPSTWHLFPAGGTNDYRVLMQKIQHVRTALMNLAEGYVPLKELMSRLLHVLYTSCGHKSLWCDSVQLGSGNGDGNHHSWFVKSPLISWQCITAHHLHVDISWCACVRACARVCDVLHPRSHMH